MSRLLGCMALVGGLASPVRGEVTTVAYRESAESFTWELRWDGEPPARPEEILPPRAGDDAPLWSPILKLSGIRGVKRGARFALQARHSSRVHELDTPQGPAYTGIFLQRLGAGSAREWTRLDRRQLPHLSTPKDPADTFDVFWLEETGVGRFLVQGAHGAGTKSKKPRKTKEKAGAEKLEKSRR